MAFFSKTEDEERQCAKCKRTLPLSQFSWRNIPRPFKERMRWQLHHPNAVTSHPKYSHDYNYMVDPNLIVCNDCNRAPLLEPAYEMNDVPEKLRRFAAGELLPTLTAADTAAVAIGTDDAGAPITISSSLRSRHLHLIGKTGTGKTTLLKALIRNDIRSGNGCAFIDPHGDAALDVLGYIPDARLADVLYFDPTSPTAPSFNPLALPFDPPKLTTDLVASFKLFFGDSWGYRMEQLLTYCLLTLITDKEPHTLADLRRLLLYDQYRDTIVARIEHASIRDFWEYEYEAASSSSPAITNKLSQFLMPLSPLERVFSNPHNDLDFPAILNGGKFLIANLSKGQIGADPARLVGGFLATGIQQAALARASIPEAERRDFFFYVDEFQNYAVGSFATILTEARKYRLCLTLAHQSFAQLPPELYAALKNVSTTVAFNVSAEDAARLTREMCAYHYERNPRAKETPPALYTTFAEVCGYFQNKAQEALRNIQVTDHGIRTSRRQLFDKLYDEVESFLKNPAPIVQHFTQAAERYVREHPDQYRRIASPTDDDLLNLPQHTAFIRIERAENTKRMKTNLPPYPDKAQQQKVFAHLEERAKNRAVAAPSAQPKDKPPITDDDLRF
jgi:hypothetical protein